MSAQVSLFTDHDAPSCVLSDDAGGPDGLGCYRYTLRIPLPPHARRRICLFVLANPSTARVIGGVFTPDPTVTRCIGYALVLGCGEVIVENVRAWRETDPDKVPPDPLAIGPENDARIRESAFEADIVVCGWGKLGGARGLEVLRALREVCDPCALKLNGDGSPAHPLYLPDDARPFAMQMPNAADVGRVCG